jgi:hypothetical protein
MIRLNQVYRTVLAGEPQKSVLVTVRRIRTMYLLWAQ